MPTFKIDLPVHGRLTRTIEARNITEARVKAKRRYEEMPVSPEDFVLVDQLQIGDIDDFRIREDDDV